VDFINRLIQRKPEYRLGYKGIAEIKYHPFFKNVDWEKLSKKQYISPFVPPVIVFLDRVLKRITLIIRSAFQKIPK
jgi:hypothetical protein